MGTRNLTVVKSNDEICVAQYGQWDGYPGGQGQTIVDFLLSEGVDMDTFREQVSDITFYEQGEFQKINEEYDKPFETFPYLTRDWDAKILHAIHFNRLERTDFISNETTVYEFDPIKKLKNNFHFGNDSIFCEWAYVLDLDEDLLYVYKGFQKEPHNKGLWAEGEKYEAVGDDEYYPVKPIVKMSINKDTLQESWNKFLENYKSEEDDE